LHRPASFASRAQFCTQNCAQIAQKLYRLRRELSIPRFFRSGLSFNDYFVLFAAFGAVKVNLFHGFYRSFWLH